MSEKMGVMAFRKAIRAIPGAGSWWHAGGELVFQELGGELVAAGIPRERALEMLKQAYGAVAGEFGA